MLDLYLPSGFFELFVEQWICLASLLSQLLKFCFALFEVEVDLSLVSEIEGDRAIDLFERQSGETVGNRFGGLAAPVSVDDRVQRHSRSRDPISSVFKFGHIGVVRHWPRSWCS